jgi:UDP-N-acetylmuramoyl-L-alanyl-D-glutamate--2,6-diaminopimelate ligase
VTLQRWLATLRDQGATHVAMEVSSHALAQKRVAGLDFTVAVLTNFTRDHLDYHGGLEAYADAKRRLFLAHDPQLAVLNMDDALGRELTERVAGAKVGYGLGARDAGKLDGFVWGENLVLCESGQQLQVLSSWGRGVLRTGLLGRFNASNLLAALAVLLALDIPFGEALRRLRRVSNVPGRMERFGADPGRPLAIVDYAHTPEALEQALRTLKEHGRGKLWCVFGCGGDRDPGKRPLMGRAAECVADRIIVTDDNPRTEDPERIIQDILAGMENPEQAWVSRDRRQAIATALREAAPEDLVLIAGKGHEDYQLIGDARIPFSDREIVRNCLEAIA